MSQIPRQSLPTANIPESIYKQHDKSTIMSRGVKPLRPYLATQQIQLPNMSQQGRMPLPNGMSNMSNMTNISLNNIRQRMYKPKIAVIGCGPSGLAAIRAFYAANKLDDYEIVGFEKQREIAGIWNFIEATGIDPDGEPIHNGMYDKLWTNVPKECLELPDMTFCDAFQTEDLPSFLPREIVQQYLTIRYGIPEIKKRIRLNTVVDLVTFNKMTQQFTISSRDRTTADEKMELFDYVYVCTGHYWYPNPINIPGLRNYTGNLIHAHDFRIADNFQGNNVLVVGSGISAEDIAIHLVLAKCGHIYLSSRHNPVKDYYWGSYTWPEEAERVDIITECLGGNKVRLKDKRELEVDTIILCTGYQHHYPFLQKDLRLNSVDSFYPAGLYKGVLWSKNPKLIYLGAQQQWLTFIQFEAQATFVRDVILGRIKTPSYMEMEQDIKKWLAKLKNTTKDGDHQEGVQFQADMIQDLMDHTDYLQKFPTYNLDISVRNIHELTKNKVDDIVGYKEKGHVNPITGIRTRDLPVKWTDIYKQDGLLKNLKNLEWKDRESNEDRKNAIYMIDDLGTGIAKMKLAGKSNEI